MKPLQLSHSHAKDEIAEKEDGCCWEDCYQEPVDDGTNHNEIYKYGDDGAHAVVYPGWKSGVNCNAEIKRT